MRRAYVTQYSPEPIFKPGSVGPDSVGEPMHLAVPFLQAGARVSQSSRHAEVI